MQGARVTALEAFRRQLTTANAGVMVGVMFDKSVALQAGDELAGAWRPGYAPAGLPPAS